MYQTGSLSALIEHLKQAETILGYHREPVILEGQLVLNEKIVLDLSLEIGSGSKITKTLKARRRSPNTRWILEYTRVYPAVCKADDLDMQLDAIQQEMQTELNERE
jgi:hypothetical protein